MTFSTLSMRGPRSLVILVLAASLLVPSATAVPAQGICNAEYDCGRPSLCATRCAFGYPCITGDDCESLSCTDSYCDATAGSQPPVAPSDPVPPTTDPETDPGSSPDTPSPDTPAPGTGGGDSAVARPGTTWSLPNFSRRSIAGFNVYKEGFGQSNRRFSPDPAVPGGPTVLEIFYPAGSVNPGSSEAPAIGGTGFYARPLDLTGVRTLTFDFEIFFPRNFNFNRGGKLPGLYGGHESCSGGRPSDDCFSTRYMWRTNGDAEVYLYLNFPAQTPAFCQVPPRTICNPNYGTSMARGSWRWQRGQWNRVSQTVRLNTIGRNDGSVTVRVNGVQVMTFGQIAWRTSNFGFAGIEFETFFGGSDPSWATPIDQSTYYKNFSLRVDA
ncbi:hypothetical protein BC831DRAFT_422570 [Entophlyctis helioformis]|nr:hypothetical protein BC831DRAFT_422570 [Entophlyctis helioformis]